MNIVDLQTTPSGYYQIAFRNPDTGHRIVATQNGNGGCVLYTPRDWEEELFAWLKTQKVMAVNHMNQLGFPELAHAIEKEENEWEDSVIISLVDLAEAGLIPIQG